MLRVLTMWLRILILVSATVTFVNCGGGGGGGSSTPAPTPEPPTTPVTYAIQVSSNPAQASASVGAAATASITWSFSANPASSSSVSYTVSSPTAGVQITGASGTASPGTTITTQLSFQCSAGGAAEAQVTLTVGTATEQLTWSITCTEEQVVFTPLAESRVAKDGAALGTLIWHFQTTGDDSTSLSYEVTSTSNRLQITSTTGTALPGAEIQNELQFACSSLGVNELELYVRIGSASQLVKWLVACTFQDITPITAKFHQGPQLGEVKFTLEDDQWLTKVVPMFYGENHELRLGSNRELYVTLEYETEEQIAIDLDLTLLNMADEVTIKKIGSSTLIPNSSGTRTNYVNRIVFGLAADDLTSLGGLQIRIDPQDAIPQRNEGINEIGFEFEPLSFVTLPHFKLTLIPILSDRGEPEITDASAYEDAIFELMPIGTYSVQIGEKLDVTTHGAFDASKALRALRQRWFSSADRDEFYHGIFKRAGTVDLCGLAYVRGNNGVTGEIDAFCSENTIAHEIGHNLSLHHAPACGTSGSDPNFPYLDGSIGREGGWYMRKQRAVGTAGLGATRIFDTMTYCIDTFTSQYSYGKALDYFVRRFGIVAAVASRPPRPVVAGFDVIEGRSLMLMGHVTEAGEWSLVKAALVDKPAFPANVEELDFEILLIHIPSGTVLHRESVELLETSHRDQSPKVWGLRIPAYDANDLHINVVDQKGNVVFENDIKPSPLAE